MSQVQVQVPVLQPCWPGDPGGPAGGKTGEVQTDRGPGLQTNLVTTTATRETGTNPTRNRSELAHTPPPPTPIVVVSRLVTAKNARCVLDPK